MQTHRWMTALFPGEKGGVCLDKKLLLLLTNAAGYHPGLVTPSTADGTQIKDCWAHFRNCDESRFDDRRGVALDQLPAGDDCRRSHHQLIRRHRQ